jgi:hypothetical protein
MQNTLNDSGTTTQYKVCSCCKKPFPKTLEFFYPVKSETTTEHFNSRCRKCESERGKKYRKENRATIKQKDLRYINQEKNFIRETFNRYFRPSYSKPKKRGIYTRKPWVPYRWTYL